MIFGEDMLPLVLSGSKSQTRRPVKWVVGVVGMVSHVAPCRYTVGRTYAVQARRGGRALGRIKVLSVERVPVQPIGAEDVAAEGFESANEFLNRYHNLNGPFSTREDCWRIEFELVEVERG